ncbi:MAG: recombinase, partial [Lachnospiraceae bacterium]|nr:recombinase [Lachnospiraceae bacterium]
MRKEQPVRQRTKSKSKAHPNRASPEKTSRGLKLAIPAESIPGKMLADVKGFLKEKQNQLRGMDKKKLFLMNFPYLLFAYFFNKIVWLYRISEGATVWDKCLETLNYFERAFASPFPSLYYSDLFYGMIGGIVVKLVVYFRAKNAKKYRQGVEYGSARWGTEKDIQPYVDPVFENNIILTATERLMMSGRPKLPKYARNKNILVIGG